MRIDAPTPIRPDMLPPHEALTPHDWHIMYNGLAMYKGQYKEDPLYTDERSKWRPFMFTAESMHLLGADIPISEDEARSVRETVIEWTSNINLIVAANRLGIDIDKTQEMIDIWYKQLEESRGRKNPENLARQLVGMRELGLDVSPMLSDGQIIADGITKTRKNELLIARGGTIFLANAKLLGAKFEFTPREWALNINELRTYKQNMDAFLVGHKLADLAVLTAPNPRIVDGRLIRS